MDQVTFIDLDVFLKNSDFKVLTCIWLTETWTRSCPIFNKAEMLESSWHNEEEIWRLRKIGILDWIYYVPPAHLSSYCILQHDLEDTFHKGTKERLVALKISGACPLWVFYDVGDAAVQVDLLIWSAVTTYNHGSHRGLLSPMGSGGRCREQYGPQGSLTVANGLERP